MNRTELVAGLADLANKLRHMWGQNPESDLLDEAVKQLQEETTEVKTATRTKKVN